MTFQFKKMKKKPKRLESQNAGNFEPKHQSQGLQQLTASLGKRDDLLHIDGIDPTTELALNSIGLRRFADFERYTPEALAKALQERTGLTVTAETIANQDWIGAAAIFMTVSDYTGTPSESHGLPGDASETSQTEQNEEKGKGALWIQHVTFTPMETPTQTNRPAMKFLRSEIVIGAEAMAVVTEAAFLCIQIHAVDTAAGKHKLLAAQAEWLQHGQTDYPVQLEFAVPGIGCYQLHIIAFLLQPEAEIAFYQGPILRVVA